MSRQLNIRSDEAYQIAHDVAERLNMTTTDVVVRALRAYGSQMTLSRDGMTPTQRAEFDALTEIARKAARHKRGGGTSDHSDMYDEFGLPI